MKQLEKRKFEGVLTAKSTFIPVKVKLPNLGTHTPFPFLSYLLMYWPSASQMASEWPTSLSWLPALRVSAWSLNDLSCFTNPVLLVVGSPLWAALSVSALENKIMRNGFWIDAFMLDLLSSEQLIGQFPDSIVGCGAGLSVCLRGTSRAIPLGGAVPEEVVSARASDRAEGFNAKGMGI